ncbi:MAG: DNA-binding response regulator, partial [Epsilonproteobacteria bacterium]|nr:DNA-binding response regulator [Campylobacterota bacterium]NPA63886.1 response regulator transcription factor [Campylobacterota bacterium]
MKILLIEDDKLLAQSLKEYLEEEGFDVDIGYDTEDALNLTFDNDYDLYLFDINLNGESGLKIVQELKEAEDETPVIFITALTSLDTIAQAFELGAVDYIKKPFHPQELVIRIKSKFYEHGDEETIRYKNIELNPKNSTIRIDGHHEPIGDVQFKILQMLMERQNQVVTKEELLSIMHNPSDVA